jgi:hypothetical protein
LFWAQFIGFLPHHHYHTSPTPAHLRLTNVDRKQLERLLCFCLQTTLRDWKPDAGIRKHATPSSGNSNSFLWDLKSLFISPKRRIAFTGLKRLHPIRSISQPMLWKLQIQQYCTKTAINP